MATAGKGRILFQLPAPIEHSSKEMFFSDFALLEKNRDFTVYVDINLSFRDSVPVFCPIQSVSQSDDNRAIQHRVNMYGGISIGQYLSSPVGSVSLLSTKDTVAKITNFGWAANGPYKFCLIHSNGKFRALTKNVSESSITTVEVIYGTFPLTSNKMGALYQGLLNAMTVYADAKTDEECIALME
jgi:hypothetical protein